MKQAVEIYIDELVLHGFSPRDRYLISAAVESELSRLFTEKGIPPSISGGGSFPVMHGENIQLTHADSGGNIGGQIASSVYSTFTAAGNKPDQAGFLQGKKPVINL